MLAFSSWKGNEKSDEFLKGRFHSYVSTSNDVLTCLTQTEDSLTFLKFDIFPENFPWPVAENQVDCFVGLKNKGSAQENVTA